jgi:diaminopimelate epimerase
MLDGDWSSDVCSSDLDGLVLLEPDPEVDFAWRFYNNDGSEAEMCGNAARCAARLAVEWGLAKGPSLAFRTLAGIIRGQVEGRRVRVQLTTPYAVRPSFPLLVERRTWEAGFINTGVPHVVLFVEDAAAVEANQLGPKFRYHQAFHPAGANANFVQVVRPDYLIVKTYERGVEAMTLACGTGVTAAALVASLRGLAKPPTTVKVPSGEELVVDYAPNAAGADPWPGPVYFEGVTTKVFTGRLTEEFLA